MRTAQARPPRSRSPSSSEIAGRRVRCGSTGDLPGTKKPVVSKSFRGGPTANVDLLVGETRIKAPIDS